MELLKTIYKFITDNAPFLGVIISLFSVIVSMRKKDQREAAFAGVDETTYSFTRKRVKNKDKKQGPET
jgi:hypothetical protein